MLELFVFKVSILWDPSLAHKIQATAFKENIAGKEEKLLSKLISYRRTHSTIVALMHHLFEETVKAKFEQHLLEKKNVYLKSENGAAKVFCGTLEIIGKHGSATCICWKIQSKNSAWF